MSKLVIFGAGYSGRAIAKALSGDVDRICGTARSQENVDLLRQMGMDALIFDGQHLSAELIDTLSDATHLIQSIPPSAVGDPLLALLPDGLHQMMPRLTWAGYLSTVGVYGNHDGEWVDEDTDCRPVSTRSRERVDAETAWQGAAEAATVPLAILRLSGIYGPGRNGLVNLKAGTARRLVKPGQVFNRIRVEDIGAAAAFLSGRHLGGIFNVTDDEPAPPQDVVAYAAGLMGITAPPEQAFETAELSPMARSFYGENKRVSNAKLRRLGFHFSYPEYRHSLLQLWQSGNWEHEQAFTVSG